MIEQIDWKRYLQWLFTVVFVILAEVCVIAGIQMYLSVYKSRLSGQRRRTEQLQKTIRNDLQYFPIPAAYREEVTYEDSYGAGRVQGAHEGCDIMDVQNREGYLPVISATDGVITNVGWLYLGGYRVGITAESGIYYYYAHLASYANGIETGKKVHAGELIGFMGSTGEGEEGTFGNFPVHLHFGIYVTANNGVESTVDSYPYLLEIEER